MTTSSFNAFRWEGKDDPKGRVASVSLIPAADHEPSVGAAGDEEVGLSPEKPLSPAPTR